MPEPMLSNPSSIEIKYRGQNGDVGDGSPPARYKDQQGLKAKPTKTIKTDMYRKNADNEADNQFLFYVCRTRLTFCRL